MAYLSLNDPNDPRNYNALGMPSNPMAGAQDGGAGVSSPAPTSSGRWTNLQQYLTGNVPQTSTMATNLITGIQGEKEGAVTGGKTAGEKYKTGVTGAAATGKSYLDDVTSALNTTGGDVTELGKKVAAAKSYTPKYDPLDLSGYVAREKGAIGSARALGTEGGRLGQVSTRMGGGRLTGGQGALTNLLLQNTPEARARLEAYSKQGQVSELDPYGQQLEAETGEAITGIGQTQKDIQTRLAELRAAPGAMIPTGATTGVQKEYGGMVSEKTKNDAEIASLNKTLQEGIKPYDVKTGLSGGTFNNPSKSMGLAEYKKYVEGYNARQEAAKKRLAELTARQGTINQYLSKWGGAMADNAITPEEYLAGNDPDNLNRYKALTTLAEYA